MAKALIRDALTARASEVAPIGDMSEVDIAYSAMFGLSSETRKNALVEIPLTSLVAYSKHPFKPYAKNKLDALIKSIEDNGLQQPIIVRSLPSGKYEILAGHNRVTAYQDIGYDKIPAIIVDVDDDQAAIIVVETNLRQREKLLPSEKAFAYKLQLDAMKHQGIADVRSASTQIAWKHESAQVIGEKNGVSRDDVRRHIRLTELISPLLDLVDAGKLAFIVGVNVSYLSVEQQVLVHQFFIVDKHAKLDVKISEAIRDYLRDGKELNEKTLTYIVQQQQRRKQYTEKTITFERKAFAPYLARVPEGDDLEELFFEFLKSRYDNV